MQVGLASIIMDHRITTVVEICIISSMIESDVKTIIMISNRSIQDAYKSD